MEKRLYLYIFYILIVVGNLSANIKIASILGDNMVLQRNREVVIWGTSDVMQKIKISTGWNKRITMVKANDKGEWTAKVATADAGGPYSIRISSGKESHTFSNIMLGEVWVCSGQSNMEMPVQGYSDQPVNGSNETLVNAENNNIRLFTVERASKPTPQDSCSGKWEIANAASVAKFSATGYFFWS